ncbi:unnamed protein product [Brassica rapa subsp. trilocularis]
MKISGVYVDMVKLDPSKVTTCCCILSWELPYLSLRLLLLS